MSISGQYQVISCRAHLALVLARVPGLHPGDPQAPLAAVLAVEDTEPEHEEDEDSDAGGKSPTRSSPGSGRPGTNIHLWQFVKELLLQPTLYGNYIHWIDRQKGIFKIVDSVKVATLWGKRKVGRVIKFQNAIF